jgi:hypothetical protein
MQVYGATEAAADSKRNLLRAVGSQLALARAEAEAEVAAKEAKERPGSDESPKSTTTDTVKFLTAKHALAKLSNHDLVSAHLDAGRAVEDQRPRTPNKEKSQSTEKHVRTPSLSPKQQHLSAVGGEISLTVPEAAQVRGSRLSLAPSISAGNKPPATPNQAPRTVEIRNLLRNLIQEAQQDVRGADVDKEKSAKTAEQPSDTSPSVTLQRPDVDVKSANTTLARSPSAEPEPIAGISVKGRKWSLFIQSVKQYARLHTHILCTYIGSLKTTAMFVKLMKKNSYSKGATQQRIVKAIKERGVLEVSNLCYDYQLILFK